MKYKVGDKVKIVKQQSGVEEHEAPIGTVGKIIKTGGYNELVYLVESDAFKFGLGINKNTWWFVESDLELVFTDDSCLKPYTEETQKSLKQGCPSMLSDVFLPKHEGENFKCTLGKPVKSDGGSSAYYFTKLPQHIIDKIVETGGIEIKDIVRYVYDNDADAFNIVKAQKRIIESRKGKGKEGIDMLYDANKIKFFAEEQYNSILQEGKE